MMDLDRRHLARGRRHVIRQRRGEDIAALVVDDFLEQRVGDALGDAAVNLAVGDHRIDQPSGVLGDQKFLDAHAPGLDVHLDDGGVAGVGKRPGRIIGGALADARRDLALEAVSLMIGGARQRLERNGAVGAGDARDIGFEHDVGSARLRAGRRPS